MRRKRNREVKKKKRATNCLLIAVFVAGLSVMLYPFISNLWNQSLNSRLISTYTKDISKMTKADLDKEFDRAKAYNDSHKVNTVLDVFGNESNIENDYMSLLNPSENGVMGYIEIPKIRERIAVYHGTSEEVLQKGCGHIEGTSLPVGGRSTHSVIAAHRGLPRAKLFTDIDQLRKGDQFYLFILNQTLAYEVDQIKVVEPDCLDELDIVEGEDYATLFTCTPYAVNTHRLLVRGHRVPYVPENNNTKTVVDSFRKYMPLILMFVLLTIIFVYLMHTIRKRKNNQTKRGGS